MPNEPGPVPTTAMGRALADVCLDAARLADELAELEDADLTRVAERLRRSVIRPLAALAAAPDESGQAGAPQPDVERRLWTLATIATALRAQPGAPNGVIEAAAALQQLVCRPAAVADRDEHATRIAELAALQAEVPAGVRVATDGPYLVSGAERIYGHLGEPIGATPTTALCRCGRSATTPFCDGSHADGFSGAKEPGRVPDRRDTHVGQQVIVLDNRGVCQHAGFCTDRLPGVFHAGSEPFVTPSGGRMDEIIRAVRDCPSGALSFAIDGREARELVDRPRPAAIEVTRDGPYRVTGGLPLTDGTGSPEQRATGASSEHYALCRCGRSRNKPFCSGAHYYADFHDPVPDPDVIPSIFEWVSGLPALTRMTRLFYEKHVPQDPLLAPLFAGMSPDHPERVAAWLGEVFGGPPAYSDQYGGYPRMIAEHVGKCLTEEQRARWAALISQAAVEAGLPNDAEFRSAFHSYIEWGSRLAVENSQTHARPPERMPMPRWDWDTAAGPPGSRVSALAPPADAPDAPDAPAALPVPDEPVGYAAHVRPLFRRQDRNAMRAAFDLWSREDVVAHAAAILARLRDGSMPCDGRWPAERVDVFARWLDAGAPE